MNRLTFASASCYCGIASLAGLAWMAICKAIILNTPPGVGEMNGINHMGWSLTIIGLPFAVPVVALIGFLLGAIGRKYPLARRGSILNGLVLILTPVVGYWAFP